MRRMEMSKSYVTLDWFQFSDLELNCRICRDNYDILKTTSEKVCESKNVLERKIQHIDSIITLFKDRNIELPVNLDSDVRSIKVYLQNYISRDELSSMPTLKNTLEKIKSALEVRKEESTSKGGVHSYTVSKSIIQELNDLKERLGYFNTSRDGKESITTRLCNEPTRLLQVASTQITNLTEILDHHANKQKVAVDIPSTLLSIMDQLNNLTQRMTAIENKFGVMQASVLPASAPPAYEAPAASTSVPIINPCVQNQADLRDIKTAVEFVTTQFQATLKPAAHLANQNAAVQNEPVPPTPVASAAPAVMIGSSSASSASSTKAVTIKF